MITNNKGDIYTNAELLSKRIDQINANVRSTQALIKRMDVLEMSLERSDECKRIQKRLDIFYKELLQYLPPEKRCLIVKIDDCCTEQLDMYAEYFYKHGYYDGRDSEDLANCR